MILPECNIRLILKAYYDGNDAVHFITSVVVDSSLVTRSSTHTDNSFGACHFTSSDHDNVEFGRL